MKGIQLIINSNKNPRKWILISLTGLLMKISKIIIIIMKIIMKITLIVIMMIRIIYTMRINYARSLVNIKTWKKIILTFLISMNAFISI